MPRRKSAPGKRPHVKATAKARLTEAIHRAFELEIPLTDTRHLVQALRMIGDGMVADRNDDGLPIAAVARAASERLDELERVWMEILKAGRR